MQEMLFSRASVNFNDYPPSFKRGSFLQRRKRLVTLTENKLSRIPEANRPTGPVERWSVERLDMPSFRKVANRTDSADPVMFEWTTRSSPDTLGHV